MWLPSTDVTFSVLLEVTAIVLCAGHCCTQKDRGGSWGWDVSGELCCSVATLILWAASHSEAMFLGTDEHSHTAGLQPAES